MKNNRRNFFKSFTERLKELSKTKRTHIISGLLVAGVVCAALLVIGYGVFSDVKLATAEETEGTTQTALNAFVNTFNITVKDGVGPFDTNTDPTAVDYCNRRGNDASDSNRRIRSYDTIFYQLNYTTALKNTEEPIEEGFLWYESILPLSSGEAIFNFTDGNTSWVGDRYDSVEELAQAGVGGYVLTEEDGQQHLIGKVWLLPKNGNPAAIPGAGSIYIAISVLRMFEGDTVEPSFALWLDGNDESEKQIITNEDILEDGGTTKVNVTSDFRMNIQLIAQTGTGYSVKYGTFDFKNTGYDSDIVSTYEKCPALDKDAGTVYGTIVTYGITLQLKNDNNADGRNLKGCELPAGDISFDLKFDNVKYTKKSNKEEISLFVGDGRETDNESFKPLVWSFDLNLHSHGQQDGRKVSNVSMLSAISCAPVAASRKGSDTTKSSNTVSGGGIWRAERPDDDKMTLNVTVSDYYPYPTGSTTPLNYFPHFPKTGYTLSPAYFTNNYNPENPLGSISTGCFTAGELHVVVPVADENGTLAEQYGEGVLSWGLRVSQEYKSYSQNPHDIEQNPDGAPSREQTIYTTKDDYASRSVTVSGGSSGRKYIGSTRYTVAGAYNFDIQYSGQWDDNGLDLAPVGQESVTKNNQKSRIGVTVRLAMSEPDRSEVAYAANILIKFDDEAFLVNGLQGQYPSLELLLYAAKPDGTGWDSDEEMNKATTEDLIYYKSLEELEAAGKICVGSLLEYRNPNPALSYSTALYSSIYLKVKDDYGLVGNVYQTVYQATVWNAGALGIDVVNDSIEEIESKFPATLANQKDLTDSKVTHEKKGYSFPVTQNEETGEWEPTPYIKTVYDDDVAKIWYDKIDIGDSVRIIGNKATVTKEVTNIGKDGKVKTTFNLNNKETTVNYKITPAVNYGAEGLDFGKNVTVMVVDTIPKGLIYNNDYKLSGNTNYSDHSIKVETDANGDTVLTWMFNDVKVGAEMPNITYSCEISQNPADGVDVGDSFTNTATIQSPGGMPVNVANGNVATAAISVTGLTQLSFSKYADKPIYEQSEDMSWTMYVGNNSSTKYTDELWLDVLPYNGDANGSDFDFPLRVKGWTIDGNGAATKKNADNKYSYQTWEVYYTTNESVREKEAVSFTASGIRSGSSGGATWHKLTLTFNGTTGTVSGLPQFGETQPTALVVIGDLEEKEMYKSTVVINTNDKDMNLFSMPGDVLVNRLSRGNSSVTGTVRVAARSISGLVWWDKDFDGLQDVDENTITTGVKVTLMQLNANGEYEPFMHNGKALTVPVGTRISGLTGKTEAITAGTYDFIELPAGTYAVRFEADNNEEFKKWSASPKDTGGIVNNAIDSDAAATYDRNERLLRTDIIDIVLPKIGTATDENSDISIIKKEHNDSGLYAYTQNLNINKVDSVAREAIEGVEFTLYRVDVDANGKWNPIDSTATIVTSNADGMVNFNALEPGYYVLKETKAADGYHLPHDATWKLSVGHVGNPVLVDSKGNAVETDSDNNYVITNNVTTMIPLTGGIGTDIFYVAGALLVISSAIMLMYQRKRRAYR